MCVGAWLEAIVSSTRTERESLIFSLFRRSQAVEFKVHKKTTPRGQVESLHESQSQLSVHHPCKPRVTDTACRAGSALAQGVYLRGHGGSRRGCCGGGIP